LISQGSPSPLEPAAGYPTAVITKIFQDIEAFSPRPAFAITTGNYMDSSYNRSPGTQNAQMHLYLGARNIFTNTVYPAMGNQECDGATADNCGTNVKILDYPKAGSTTENYLVFANSLLSPIRQTLPYYTIHINAPNGKWTSKFVFVACNAWSSTQATWLAAQLSLSTTYTFVVRNEPSSANTAPCLTATPSADTIMKAHPYTLLIAGHSGTYAYYASEKEVIVGNGGAPLSSSVDYGYVIAQQQVDGSIVFKEYDYRTNAQQATFTVR
jgi:hypothetical protein